MIDVSEARLIPATRIRPGRAISMAAADRTLVCVVAVREDANR
jgi:hypothetical protein